MPHMSYNFLGDQLNWAASSRLQETAYELQFFKIKKKNDILPPSTSDYMTFSFGDSLSTYQANRPELLAISTN